MKKVIAIALYLTLQVATVRRAQEDSLRMGRPLSSVVAKLAEILTW